MTIAVGVVVEGFRIEAVIGRGTQGVTYEATQLALGRRVALKLLDEGFGKDPSFAARFREEMRVWASLHHPRLVVVYDAGESAYGPFVAMQLVRGATLEAVVRERGLDPTHALRVLEQIAEALDAAHAVGLVHGDVTSRNVLIDGDERAFLGKSVLGTMTEPASSADDRAAFAAMVAGCVGDADSPVVRRALSEQHSEDLSASALVAEVSRALESRATSRARGRKRLYLVACSCLALAGILAVTLAVGSAPLPAIERQAAPTLLSGAVALGSDLAPGPARATGCDGLPLTPNSPACTIMQSSLSDRPLLVAADGVIRSWAVRGARGQLRLQVLRPLADGRLVRVFASQIVEVADEGVHVVAADLEVRKGDRVGVALLPGAAIGIRSGKPAATLRWFGPLTAEARAPNSGEGTGFDDEILLRADVVPGAERELPAQLSGAQAANAPPGTALSSINVELDVNAVVRIALVRLPDRIVLDMFRGTKRISRIEIPDVDAAGSLVEFGSSEFADSTRTGGLTLADVRLAWTNPGARIPLEHRWALTPEVIQFLD